MLLVPLGCLQPLGRRSVPCRLGEAMRTELYPRPPVEFLALWISQNSNIENIGSKEARENLVMAEMSGGSCLKPISFMKKAV